MPMNQAEKPVDQLYDLNGGRGKKERTTSQAIVQPKRTRRREKIQKNCVQYCHRLNILCLKKLNEKNYFCVNTHRAVIEDPPLRK